MQSWTRTNSHDRRFAATGQYRSASLCAALLLGWAATTASAGPSDFGTASVRASVSAPAAASGSRSTPVATSFESLANADDAFGDSLVRTPAESTASPVTAASSFPDEQPPMIPLPPGFLAGMTGVAAISWRILRGRAPVTARFH